MSIFERCEQNYHIFLLFGGNQRSKKTQIFPTLDDSLFKAYSNTSSNGKISLVISKQPEKQHRARYHTEGSRGAVKDRGQNSFPTVQLRGYNPKKLAVLQVFVGSDTGTPIPHLYYQACKVSGKNSTPCREMKKENTGPSMSLPKQFQIIQNTS